MKWLPVSFILAPAVVYTASWSGWFATSDGYDRNWAAANGNHTPVWNVIDSWYQYNHWMLEFGLTLTSYQSYRSNPLGWPVLARPISFYWCEGSTPSCHMPASTASEVRASARRSSGGAARSRSCSAWAGGSPG